MNHFNRSNQQRHVLFIFLLSLFCGLGSAQECACSPSEYKFTLDFSLVCPPVNITRNGGVESTYCQISGFGGPDEDITDLVPVAVSQVDVLELESSFSVINNVTVTGPFLDGDSFSFSSIIKESDSIPTALQINIFGVNGENQPIVNYFAIEFTNDCGIEPVFDAGNFAGWVYLTSFEPPPSSSCTAVPPDFPTMSPTYMSMSMSFDLMSAETMDAAMIEEMMEFGRPIDGHDATAKSSKKSSKKGSKRSGGKGGKGSR